jgi:hypothetical protein
MFKRFATLTAGLAIAFAALGSPAHAAGHHPAPDRNDKAALAFATRATGSDYKCHLKWTIGYDVVCKRKAGRLGYTKMVKAAETCRKTGRRNYEACVSLYMRAPHTSKDGSSYTPYGFFLVRECTSQYHGVELRDCLRQPAES